MRSSTWTTPLAVAVVIVVAVSACGGSTSGTATVHAAPPPSVAAAPSAPVRPTASVDEIVRIDRGRMHLRCVGEGRATVVLVAGWGVGGETWDAVAPPVAEHARVCSYSRFGAGRSDASVGTQTFTTQASDLHELLAAAGEPGPYVLGGHSFGGAEAIAFASAYAEEVAGVLLLDATPTNWPAVVCSVPAYEPACAVMRDPALDPERVDVFPAFAEVAAIASLGDLPVTVVTAAHREPHGLSADELERLDAAWLAGTGAWVGLSSRSKLVPVEDTGHHIELDRPQLVIDELLDLVG